MCVLITIAFQGLYGHFCQKYLLFPWAHMGALQVTKTVKGLGIFAFILKYLSP